MTEVRFAVELEVVCQAKTGAHGPTEHACAGGGADQSERFDGQGQSACIEAIVNFDIDLKVFHGGIQEFFQCDRQAMDFVNEQHSCGTRRCVLLVRHGWR